MRSIYQWFLNLGKMTEEEARRMAQDAAIKQVGLEHYNRVAYVAVNGRRICSFVIYTNPESIYVDNLEEARDMFETDFIDQLRWQGRIKKGGCYEK